MKEITGKEAHEWTPSPKDKDLADLNARQQGQEEPLQEHFPGMSR